MSEVNVTVTNEDPIEVAVTISEVQVTVTNPPAVNISIASAGDRGPQGPPGEDGDAGTPPELDLHIMWNLITKSSWKVFTYTMGALTKIEMYTDSSLAIKVFTKDFVYVGSDISTTTVTRISDGKTEIKTFTFLTGALQTIGTAQS